MKLAAGADLAACLCGSARSLARNTVASLENANLLENNLALVCALARARLNLAGNLLGAVNLLVLACRLLGLNIAASARNLCCTCCAATHFVYHITRRYFLYSLGRMSP